MESSCDGFPGGVVCEDMGAGWVESCDLGGK